MGLIPQAKTSFLLLVWLSAAIKRRHHVHHVVRDAVVEPQSLYCATPPSKNAFISSSSEEAVSTFTYPSTEANICQSDSICTKAFSDRPFCYESACVECRPDSATDDCGMQDVFCQEETGYTCSQCASDSDCPRRGQKCRAVRSKRQGSGAGSFTSSGSILTRANNGPLSRYSCVACRNIPKNAEILDTGTCAWTCPAGYFYSTESKSCVTCPTCSVGETYFSSAVNLPQGQCTNSTDVVCASCTDLYLKGMNGKGGGSSAGLTGSSMGLTGSTSGDNSNQISEFDSEIGFGSPGFCASMVAPAADPLSFPTNSSLFVGDLGPSLPCRFFTCNAGWYLDLNMNKCRQCGYSSCSLGHVLQGCGGSSPGECATCASLGYEKPANSHWLKSSLDDPCQYS